MRQTDMSFELLRDALTRPEGLLALALLFLMGVTMMLTGWGRWGAVSLVLLVSSFGWLVQQGIPIRPLVTPLEQVRQYGRPLTIGMLVLLLVPTALSQRGWRNRAMLAAIPVLLLLQIWVSVRLVAAGSQVRGVTALFTFLLIFICFGYGMSRWLQSGADVRALVRTLAVTGMLFIVVNLYQVALNPAAAVWYGRFHGVTGNPQFAGALMTMALLPTLYLLASRDEAMWFRTACAVSAGLLCLLLIWTGSRTWVAMPLLGVAVLFHRRLGRALVILAITAGCAWMAAGWLTESTASAERLASLHDSRSQIWLKQIQVFLANPVFGTGAEQPQESSYLGAAANYGIIGAGLLALFVVLTGLQLFRLHRAASRWLAGEDKFLVDLVLALAIVVFTGALGEGYLLGTLSLAIFTLYMVMAVTAFILDATARGAAGAVPLTQRDEAGTWDYSDVPQPGGYYQPAAYR